ncbi:Rapamycin-insensitive companion of mTOR, N-term-domain-containing protein [Halteromyces radiatus]|uniref:Rapamycin-insensitive companion of mTOR, N-term-domain-containing protein n=1 Tax=Halteromyces radiatus TaxID=101107 RepID=UPI00221FABE8|nr:Rapamycin-insensitive companion of mTOR, N-term-domain-containing protein [Halteromyces radiatus]KAI8088648.1 Rapamycin-insensitive companion of mTOR, N-term-domain-containing protein [Halteromyces radiatus]
MSCTPPITSPTIPSLSPATASEDPLFTEVDEVIASTSSPSSSPPPPPPPPPPIPPPPPPPSLPSKVSADDIIQLEEWLIQLDREKKMKLGVENMLEAYLQDKKRTKELEGQLESYNATIDTLAKNIERIRMLAGKNSTEVTTKLVQYKYTFNTSFPASIPNTTLKQQQQQQQQQRGKPRSNSFPKGKQQRSQESISFRDDDAWPLGKRLHHVMEQLGVDEWKPTISTMESNAIKESKVEKLDTLVRILKTTNDTDVYYPKKKMIACLRQCIASPHREVRVLGLRALRHLVDDPVDVELMMQMQIDIFIVRAMSREPDNYEPEREQTMKLVRAFLQYNGTCYLSQNIVRAVVAVAEQTDCRLRNICLETIAELAILDTGLTVRSGGLRVIMQALLDGQRNMAEVLSYALLYILDTPERRTYLRPGVELETIIAPFTESSKGANYEDRLKNSARVVTLLLKSWAGILYMCANSMRAARSVVQALRTPVVETKKMVLDMFFDIFHVQLPKDHNNFLTGRQHTVTMCPPDSLLSKTHLHNGSVSGMGGHMMMGEMTGSAMASDETNISHGRTTASNSERLKMMDQHLSIVLIIFIESDILMALIDMVKSDDVYISRKATLLIGEILQLSTRLLPILMGIQIQSLPKLFALASNFDDELVRHNATAALAHIDRLTRARARYAASSSSLHPLRTGGSSGANGTGGNDSTGDRGTSTTRRMVNNGSMMMTTTTTTTTQEKVHEVKLKMGYAIDDAHFRQLLLDSQVLNTKDYTKWSWDHIVELLQGPLLNPKRLDEAMRGKKFIKRLLAFYRPFKHQFSDINCTKANVIRYVKTGCILLSTLLGNVDGVRYLEENKLLDQVAAALVELDPLKQRDVSSDDTEPIFSKERMSNTLSGGYFTFLGVFTKHKDGVRIMEKFKLFSSFYQLSELRNRDDLKVALITNMDYTLDGHPRVLLSKIMTSGYNPIRIFATQHLGHIMRQAEDNDYYNDWIIRLLVTQLYDTHLQVAQIAVNLLDEACEKQANLELLVKCRPSLGHLGEVGNPLLLRFLSTSTGFRYLSDLDYVQKEMDDWFEYRNQQYVIQLELSLARALVNSPEKKINPFEERVDSELDFELLQPGDGLSPPHFYGELTKTEEGCALLRENGHFQLFTDYIRSYALETQDAQVIQHLKSVLWAVGNIGSTRNGLPFLEEEDIVKDIVYMAENSEVLSLKGTCFYVLGLIAKTQQGVELLGELGWESVVGPNGHPEGLCVPLKLQGFLTIRNWQYTPTLSDPPQLPKSITEDTICTDILRNIGDMSNHILANEASSNLRKLRQKHPDYFKNVQLYYSVCQLLGSYHFRSPVRKFILEAFDMRFTPELLQELDDLAVKMEEPQNL